MSFRGCSVDGCERELRARGFCATHYARFKRNGTERPFKTARVSERMIRRGWTVTESGCWEWNGTRSAENYGSISVGNKTRLTHRLAYETWVGPIPEGNVVRHKCDNPPCMRPEHLEVGTYRDNTQDMIERGRSAWHKSSHLAKLSWAKVREARLLASEGRSARELAEDFGVGYTTMCRVLSGKTWKEPANQPELVRNYE